jgi:hypothetical protein
MAREAAAIRGYGVGAADAAARGPLAPLLP